jgi:hypothetical protein
LTSVSCLLFCKNTQKSCHLTPAISGGVIRKLDMEHIKLMPDYGCFPLWYHKSEKVGDIDPETLGISSNLCKKLTDWQSEYDQTLDHIDPRNSCFGSKEKKVKFVAKGYELALALKAELAGVQVIYFDIDQVRERNV